MSDKNTVTAIVPFERRALAPFEFTEEDRKIIRESKCPGATDAEFAALMRVAVARRLSPLTGQIHFIKRRRQENGRWIEFWTYQTSIDGFRSIAEDTGLYDGQDEPEFLYNKDNAITCCKVKVYKKGISRPFVGVAFFDEYAQYTDKGLIKMWAEKPHVMLAKCAEALGLRKAFPEPLCGLYAPEELDDDGTVRGNLTPPKPILDGEIIDKPVPAPETLTQRADRLILACSVENITPAQMAAVSSEAAQMPKGPERDRVREAYGRAQTRQKEKTKAQATSQGIRVSLEGDDGVRTPMPPLPKGPPIDREPPSDEEG